MYYDDEVMNAILNADVNNIRKVVSEYTELRKINNLWFGACPIHEEKKLFSLCVDPKEGVFQCMACGAGGNVIEFLMNVKKCSFREAVAMLAARAGVFLPEVEKKTDDSAVKAEVLKINLEAARFYFYALRKKENVGMDYFKKRKLSDATMNKFGLGYAADFGRELYDHLLSKNFSNEAIMASGLIGYGDINYGKEKGYYDKFWNRVVFPIVDIHNRVIGFGGRVLDDSKPKYLNSPETVAFDKSRNLYGLNLAQATARGSIILCEGFMDTISMHQAGFDNAVASLGTSLTEQQAAIIRGYVDKVYLAYDSDEPGVKAAMRAIPMLKAVGCTVKIIRMDKKDPDEFIKTYGKEAFEKRIVDAEPSDHFVARTMPKTDGYYEKVAEMLMERL